MADTDTPTLLGVIADPCDGCSLTAKQPTTTAKYMLPCEHIICLNCLTQYWYHKPPSKKAVICPQLVCMKDSHFLAPKPIELVRVDQEMLDEANKIRLVAHIAFNNIVVDHEEAQLLLTQLYELAQDQMMSPEALGGLPNHMNPEADDAYATIVSNPFFCALYNRFSSQPENMNCLVKVLDLDDMLRTLIDEQLLAFAMLWYGLPLSRNVRYQRAAQAGDGKAALRIVKEEIQEVREKGEVWAELLGMFVGLLVLRHLARFETDEGEGEGEGDVDTDGVEDSLVAAFC